MEPLERKAHPPLHPREKKKGSSVQVGRNRFLVMPNLLYAVLLFGEPSMQNQTRCEKYDFSDQLYINEKFVNGSLQDVIEMPKV